MLKSENLYAYITSSRMLFRNTEVTEATFELIFKIIIATDWSKPHKALSSCLAIIQVFKPSANVSTFLRKKVENLVFSKNYSAQSEKIQKMCNKMENYEAHMDVGILDDLSKTWSNFANSDLGLGFAQLAIILVTIGFLPEINFNFSGVELYSLRKAQGIVKAKDIFVACKLVLNSVLKGVSNYEISGYFDGFFSSDSLESKISKTLALYQQVLIGNLSSYADGMSNEQYVEQLEKLRVIVERKMKDPKSSDKFFYKAYMDRINDTLSSMASIQMEQQSQEQAFALMFHGNSSVGKSWFAIPMIRWLLEINSYPCEPANIITYNTNSKYDDQVRNNTYGILLDDLANGKVGKGGAEVRRTSDVVISLINNVAQSAVKADLAEKGKVLMKPKVVIATTNNRGLNAAQESHNEASVHRRFKYEIEFCVKEEFCVPNSTELNADLVSEMFSGKQFPPVWEFKISKCFITEKSSGDGKGFTMKIVQSPPDAKGIVKNWFEIDEFMNFMKDESKKHFSREKKALEVRNALNCQTCQSCSMPQEICKCGYDAHISVDDVCEYTDSLLNELYSTYTSFKRWVFFTTELTYVNKLWTICQGNIRYFMTLMCILHAFLPVCLIIFGGIYCKMVGIITFVLIVFYIKDMTVLIISRIFISMSFESCVCNRMCSLFNEVNYSIILRRFVVLGISIYILKLAASVVSQTYGGHSIEANTVEEENEKMLERSVWEIFRGLGGNTAGGKTMNMTTDQLVNRVAQNVVHVSVYSENKIKRVNGVFVSKGYLVIPLHFVNSVDDDVVLHICRQNGRVEKVRVDFSSYGDERQWVSFGKDLVMIRLTGVNFSRNIVDLFSKRISENGFSKAKMLHRKENHEINIYDVTGLRRKFFKYSCNKDKNITGDGYIGTCSIYPTQGMCTSLLVADMKKPELVGVHIAGMDKCYDECSQAVTQDMLLKAIEALNEVCVFQDIAQDEAYDSHMCNVTGDIHPFCPTKNLSEHVPIDAMGAVGGTGPRRMYTKKTPYHDDVCKYFDINNPYGIPKSTATYKDGKIISPWTNCIDELERTKNMMPYTSLCRAKHEIVECMLTKMEVYKEAGGICRPLTAQEAINGIPGVRGLDGQKMSTAAGIKYGKTKASHLENEEYPYVYKDYVYKDIENIIESLASGKRIKNCLNSNLKDEPLKLSKVESYRTRVFFSDELDMMTVVSMYFGPVMSYMMQHPESAHSAIGLNAESYDWECVLDYLLRKGEKIESKVEDGVALDFAAFDKTLPENLMKMSWQVMIDIAEAMGGYSSRDLKIMKGIADEKTTPYIWFNGTLVQCNFSHSSGNGCTAPVGSIAGLMMLCIAFYDINDKDGLKNMRALDYVRSIHLGDDCASTVIRKEEHNFNFITLQESLQSFGVTITLPDKESIPTEFQNILEEDFLKRHFHTCVDRYSVIGKLDEKSLYKSMLYFLPSKVETVENQLGQALSSVLKESSLHGRETFTKYHNFIQELSTKHNIPVVHLSRNYEDFVVNWAYDSGKRHTEYRFRSKPTLENIAKTKKIDTNKQIKIFGKTICEVEEQSDLRYEAHAEELEAHIGIVDFEEVTFNIQCCLNPCCRKKSRKVEEEIENNLSSGGSGRTNVANTSASIENDSVETIPTSNLRVPLEVIVPPLSGGLRAAIEWMTCGCLSSTPHQS
jgi:hypothetical protein